MFSHITVGTQDLERAGRFYDALLIPLGHKRRAITPDGGPAALCWVASNSPLPRFYVYSPFNGQPATAGNGSMVAFLAPSTEAVNEAYTGAMACGARMKVAPIYARIMGTAISVLICVILTETNFTSFIAAIFCRTTIASFDFLRIYE